MPEQPVTFGPFELFPAQRLLVRCGKRVPIGGRAFDLLVVLVGRAGQVVNKDELTAAVWSGIFVEGSSLRKHIAELRKALNEDRSEPRIITNVPGRGYCFVATTTTRPPRKRPHRSRAERHPNASCHNSSAALSDATRWSQK